MIRHTRGNINVPAAVVLIKCKSKHRVINPIGEQLIVSQPPRLLEGLKALLHNSLWTAVFIYQSGSQMDTSKRKSHMHGKRGQQ